MARLLVVTGGVLALLAVALFALAAVVAALALPFAVLSAASLTR